MKITICTRKFVPPNLVGGVDVYADRLGRAFQRLGHAVTFLAVDAQAEIGKEPFALAHDDHHGMPVTRLKFVFSDRPKEYFDVCYDPDVGRIVRDILQEDRPDLFIVMNFYTITLAVVEAAKSLGIPVVHVATDFLPICRRATLIRWDGRSCQTGESIKSCSECFVARHPFGRVASTAVGILDEGTLTRVGAANYRFPHPLAAMNPYWNQVQLMVRRQDLLQPLREQIDLILAPTEYTKTMFLKSGFKPDQVWFLPYGVEAESPLTRVIRTGSPHTRFVFVGRLQPYKGAHLLIEAFNSLESPNGATLTIFGSADGHEEYFEHLQEISAGNQAIRLPGTLAQAEIWRAYAEADYFVLPSTWNENSPFVLLEALQSGTPIIASNIGGVTDLVRHADNGFLFPVGDVGALRQVLQQAIDYPELKERLRPRSELFTVDEYVKTIVSWATAVDSPVVNSEAVAAHS